MTAFEGAGNELLEGVLATVVPIDARCTIGCRKSYNLRKGQ